MRYRTVGDWQWDDLGNLTITIADTTNWKSNFCVAIHELVEAMLCRQSRITQDEVDAFDFDNQQEDEPGDLTACPYYSQHQWATTIERFVATCLLLDWRSHEKNCEFAWSRTKIKKGTTK